MSSLRSLVRIARRDAVHAKGRSALIIAMIALPVAGMTFIDVAARTAQLSPSEQATHKLGNADVRVAEAFSGETIEQSPDAQNWSGQCEGVCSNKHTPAEAVLPAGSRTLTEQKATVTVQTQGGLAPAGLVELAYDDPMVSPRFRQEDGRAPRAADEVAITPKLLERTGLHIGDTLVITKPAARFTIVGTVADRESLKSEAVYARPGALIGPAATGSDGPQRFVYADTPGPFTWDQVLAANQHGVAALSRAVLLDPPPRSAVPFYQHNSSDNDAFLVVLVLVLIVGLATLEIVLLAGAAFAVGARRQSRALALVAASGGDSRHVRRIVLAGGGVLGVTAAVIGIVGGVTAAAITMPIIERLSGAELGAFDVRPAELLAIALIGVGTGLLAAIVPARSAAKLDVVAVLAGRRGTTRTPRKVPVIGLIVSAVGVALAVLGSGLALQRATSNSAQGSGGGDVAASLILIGAALTQIGLIIASGAIVGLAAKLGRFMPLAPRLALRDAGRHRGRSAPAIAAVMAAVAGSVALSLFVVATDEHDRRTYTYTARPGQAMVLLAHDDLGFKEGGAGGAESLDPEPLRAAVSNALPVHDSIVVNTLSSPDSAYLLGLPLAKQCPLALTRMAGTKPSDADVARYRDDPRCKEYFNGGLHRSISGILGVPVGGSDVLRAIAGRTTPEAEAALANGGMVVFDRANFANGKGAIEVLSPDSPKPRTVEIPAVLLPVDIAAAPAVLSPQAVRLLGPTATTHPGTLLFNLDRLPSHTEEDRARAAIAATGDDPYFNIERGYQSNYAPGLLILLIGSAVITLGAAGIATGLAQADARPDHATLAAVGAPPAVRRVLAMCSAAVIAGLGTLLGIAAGFVPAAAYLGAVPDMHLIMPWASLALTVVVVPVIAALCAGAFTRSRLPLERRMA